MATTIMKLEMDTETCSICGGGGELLTPEEYDAGGLPMQVPLRTMLLQINNNKVVPEGRFCSGCIRRTIDAYEFSSVLSSRSVPPLSEKIRNLRRKLLDLTQKIDVFIVVGGPGVTAGGSYSEDDIIMVDKDALAAAASLDDEDMEKARNAVGESVYQCTVCPMTFQRASEYRAHADTHGAGGGAGARHSCWTCGAQFTSPAALRDHRAQHAPSASPHTCALCSQTFQSSGELRAHAASCPAQCPLCSLTFPSRDQLAAHAQLKHSSNTGPSVCALCLRVVAAGAGAAHALAHRQAERFVCGFDACILRFPTRADLLSHIRSCHAGARGVAGVAGAGAGAGGGEAGATDKGADRDRGAGAGEGPEERAVVPCAHCRRTFGSIAAMKRHAHVHRREAQQDEDWADPEAESGDVEYLELETLDDMNDYHM